MAQSDCMIWPGSIGKHGYGMALHEGRVIRAHRLAYIKAHGEIPKGLVIRHLCNIKACYNVEHLRAGTQRENVLDASSIGRMSRYGKSNPKAKLTSEEVMEIRRLHNSGCSKLSIARLFHTTRRNVSYIVNNKTRVYA